MNLTRPAAAALALLAAIRLGAADAPSLPAPADQTVVATVNGEPIFVADLERRLASLHSSVSEGQRSGFKLDEVIFRLVNDTLIGQDARALELHLEPPIPAKVAALRQSLAVKRLQQEEISGLAEPSEEEIRQVFASDYRTVTLRIITAHERAEAESILARLRDGADFEALARAESKDSYSARGGLMVDRPKAELPPDFAAAAFGHQVGELAGPLQTAVGFAVIRVESFADPAPESFAAARGDIRKLIVMQRTGELKNALLARLRATHQVSVDDAALAAIGASRLADGRLQAELPDPAAAVARVDERTITAAALAKALNERWNGIRNEAAALATKPMLLDRLVGDELLAAEALARGYGDTAELRQALHAYETQLVVPHYLEQVVSKGVEVSEVEIAAYYEANRQDFAKAPRIHRGQITVATEEEATRLADLLRQGADLAWLARQHSIDGYRESGGDRGWMVPTRDVDAFQDALLNAQPPLVLGPYGDPGSYVVTLVDAREERGVFSLEETSANIKAALYSRKFAAALDLTIQALRARSQIVVKSEVLAALEIFASPAAAAPPAHSQGHGGG